MWQILFVTVCQVDIAASSRSEPAVWKRNGAEKRELIGQDQSRDE